MNAAERMYKIDQLLRDRGHVSMQSFISVLEVSKATVKRDLNYMRDRLHAPIAWDRVNRGYRYEDMDSSHHRFALPGLWFNSSEIHALMTLEHSLRSLQPGFLASRVKPLRERIHGLIGQDEHSVKELVRRIRMLPGTSPRADPKVFQAVADALLSRSQILAQYSNRSTDETTERYISPQRLAYYDQKWYLDGWCHLRESFRTFGLVNMTAVKIVEVRAIEIDDETLDSHLTAGFGIFVGDEVRHAVLRFDSRASRWVKDENWHSEQTGEFDDQGRYILTVPYSNDPELVQRVLQFGPSVEVLQPAQLREKIAKKVELTWQIYRNCAE